MSFGSFDGEVIARWLRHGGADRDMELLEDFAYIDPSGQRWFAPKGSVVNGASIPEALWATVGPPFVGDYRRASVVHDVACDERSQPHDDVHLMFYHAMRADGMGWTKANVMYQAVKRFGPRWSIDGATLELPRVPEDEVVVAFAHAVAQAAEEVGPEQDLEAVERRTDEILLAKIAGSREMPNSRSKKSSNKKQEKPRSSKEKQRSSSKSRMKPKTVSRVRKLDEETSSSEKGGTAASIERLQLEGSEPEVRKQLATSAPLTVFRAEYLEGLSYLSPVPGRGVSGVLFTAAADSLARDGTGETEQFAESPGAANRLSDGERLRLVEQALVLLEQNYVHRPLKEAMYAVDPVQALRLLREQVRQPSDSEPMSDVVFHRQLSTIFHSVRDLHTNYFLPEPISQQTAYLPFLVEDYFAPEGNPVRRRFVVTRKVGQIDDPQFGPGVEILRWNGVPIERAVELNGDRYAGSNPEARRSRGIETLTVRPLIQSLPPDEDYVDVEYLTDDGERKELRFDWIIFSPETGSLRDLRSLTSELAVAQGIDVEQAITRAAKKVLFAPEAVAAASRMKGRSQATRDQGLASLLPHVLTARPVQTEAGEFAHVRIRTFDVDSADRFVDEFVRLLELLPQEGLIIDVRGNGGGLILAGEQLLQVLTPRPIEPTLFQFINTPLNRRMVEQNDFLAPWRDSMRQAVRTGAAFSQGFPITSPEKANEIGQRYHGPVVLITDALCYSTTDIFAAGFQDHEIGTIIGTDNNTGAGGANVWTHGLLMRFLSTDSPYQSLPRGADLRVSMRRTIRVGKSNGTVLEDLGVVPDTFHPMTRDDLLNNNVDLMERAGKVLAHGAVRVLRAEAGQDSNSDTAQIQLETAGLDRVDLYAAERPLGSVDVSNGSTRLEVIVNGASQLALRGFAADQWVASRLLDL